MTLWPLWLGWIVMFGVLEAKGLWKQNDKAYPFTYYVRQKFALRRGFYSPGWWLIASGLGWLAWHFLIASTG